MSATMTARPATRMYTPPEGTYDQPFTWIYDASNLTDGVDALNQIVYIKAGFGDFICRRIVGLASVLNPTGGQFQIYDRWIRPLYSAPTNVTGTDTDDQMLIRELDYPETSAIHLDLYDVLRDPALVIQFLAANDSSPGDSWSGTAFGTISASNGVSSQGGRLGLFKSASAYVSFLYDHTANKIRCYTSTDLATWTEQDAAGAPTYGTAGLGGGGLSPNIAVCQSSDSNIFYVLYFGTGGSVATQFLTVQSFTVGTGWGTNSVSTLTLDTLSTALTFSALGNCQAVFRPSDGSVFFIAGGLSKTMTGGTTQATYYAQCFPGGAGWINSWNLCGPDPATFIVVGGNPPPAGTNSIAACLDSAGNICVVSKTQVSNTPFGVQQFHLYLERIHPDNSLGGVSEFETANLGTNGYLTTLYCSSAGNLYLGYLQSGASGIYTAATGDAPVFSKTAFPAAAGSFPTWCDFVSAGGTIYALILATDSQTVLASAQPFTSTATLGMTPVAMFVASALFAAAGSTVIRAQIAFQGVRRQQGPRPLVTGNCPFEPRAYSYTQTVTINAAGPAPVGTPTISIFQTVNDYDFELDEILITYTAAALPANKAVTMVQLYDAVKNVTSNVPMLDSFMNGAPGSPYRNGAMVPALIYPQQSQIRLDIYSMIESAYLPVTMSVEFKGRQRYPCANC